MLFGVVSRLTEQKGLDVLLSACRPSLPAADNSLPRHRRPAVGNRLKNAAAAHPGAVASNSDMTRPRHIGHRRRRIVLVPSRFEPCGLTQIYALAYGSLPLVHRVGGLADTVVDSSLENLADDLATGFVFDAFERSSIVAAIRRAFALKGRRADWKAVVRRAMTQNFGWEAGGAGVCGGLSGVD